MLRQLSVAAALPLMLATSLRGQRPTAALLPELDRFAAAIVQNAKPLALAVVVVRGDSILHLATYGTSTIDGARPLTANTSFYIASSTKSFTALTAALLAARGQIDLDVPIARYVPAFSLPAPIDAERVTLRRLLSHRGGFESGPLAFRTAYTGDVAPDSLVPLIARTARPVDTGFTYTNTAFILAAQVLAQRTRVPWQQLVTREVLTPLGMTKTTALPDEAAGIDVVEGFGPGPVGFRPLRMKPDALMHAAGGLVMSANDAATWLRAQINDGRVGGRQIFPTQVFKTTHQPVATQRENFDGIQRFAYALGWQLGLLDGDTLYHHFGNYPGAFAHISFIPRRNIGVAVFSNSEMPALGPVPNMIARRAYDLLAARHERDSFYAAYPDTLAANVKRMYDVFRRDAERRAARPKAPARGWKLFEGRYVAPDMGGFDIIARGDSAADMRYGVTTTKLEVLSGDTLRVELPPGRGGAALPVAFGPDGRPTRVTLQGVTFSRVP